MSKHTQEAITGDFILYNVDQNEAWAWVNSRPYDSKSVNVKRDVAIFKLRYCNHETLREIGERYGLSANRIRHICWEQMRRASRAKNV